jgi:anti-sigma factor RsiW
MRCPEFRETARAFLDGEVDDSTRREFALHLAGCPDCARLIEEGRFWDDALRDYLNCELPDGLRQGILGDLAQGPVDMGWRQKLGVIWWASRKDLSPRVVLQTAALVAFLVLALNYLPFFQSSDKPGDLEEAFQSSGPIVGLGEDADWKPGETVPTARLKLSGRLI